MHGNVCQKRVGQGYSSGPQDSLTWGRALNTKVRWRLMQGYARGARSCVASRVAPGQRRVCSHHGGGSQGDVKTSSRLDLGPHGRLPKLQQRRQRSMQRTPYRLQNNKLARQSVRYQKRWGTRRRPGTRWEGWVAACAGVTRGPVAVTAGRKASQDVKTWDQCGT